MGYEIPYINSKNGSYEISTYRRFAFEKDYLNRAKYELVQKSDGEYIIK
ncbi:unnamed protein product [marine sediment metagenome]|uniref:Uncharacterized protein n=1 Tax=marine sediment metagenome TaxID=412755 RepID=X1UAQ4_9ZZZZ